MAEFADGSAAEELARALQELAVAEDHVKHLEQALRSSRRIGMAMGILMERSRLTEQQAFDELATTSSHRNVKLRDVADEIVYTGEAPRTAGD